jgi:hypothetical protein
MEDAVSTLRSVYLRRGPVDNCVLSDVLQVRTASFVPIESGQHDLGWATNGFANVAEREVISEPRLVLGGRSW